jgi:predicted HTH domain antitoxin
MINLTVRSKKDVVTELDRVAALKHLDRAQLLRIILEKGLEKEKLDLAIELYIEGDTMERASEVANVSIWEVMDALHARGVARRFDVNQEKAFIAKALEKEYPDLARKIMKL